MSNMFVTKRNGSLEAVNIQKIINSVANAAQGVPDVDIMTVAVKTIGSLHDGATTRELDELAIRTSANLISQDPNYTFLASNLLLAYIEKEARMSGVTDVASYLYVCGQHNLISQELDWAISSLEEVDSLVDDFRNHFKYFGLKTLYDRYLLRHPVTRKVVETPALFFLRIAVGVGPSPAMDGVETTGPESWDSPVFRETAALYRSLFEFKFLFGTPTLFNAGTPRSQMSSCYVLDSPEDSITGIFKTLGDVAQLSKMSGGLGAPFSRIRGRHSLIKGTNGLSNGIIPFLKIYDSTIACVDQGGGKRKGSLAAYLEPWHCDIEEFLEAKNNTGDQAARTHNLNLANWIPDDFMCRVKDNQDWYLFSPDDVPHFVDLYGEQFDQAYAEAVEKKLYKKKIPARELYLKMMKTLAETGNGWMCFKDTANELSNIATHGNVIHSSNLCVAPETLVLTDRGNIPIESICDEEVNVWNGEEWSSVTVRQTGADQSLLRVSTSDGRSLRCTPYHKFYVQNDYHKPPAIVPAHSLKLGDKLIKLTTPVIHGEDDLDRAYENGFFTGDGTELKTGASRIYLYGEKMALANEFTNIKWHKASDREMLSGQTYGLMPKFFVPSAKYTVASRLAWISGWLDADGTVARNGINESLQGASINEDFLLQVQSMLLTLGVNAKVTKLRSESTNILPLNDGTDLSGPFQTKAIWRLLISSGDTQSLLDLGLSTKRLSISKRDIQRNAQQFSTITSIAEDGVDNTYCFTEPKRHMGVFNGILTGNCTEIFIPNNQDLTSVCNLASLNLAALRSYDELEKYVPLVVRALDRVIDRNCYPTSEARASNLFYRPIGLGEMGLQDVFFQEGIAFDSDEALQISTEVSRLISIIANEASLQIAKEKSPYPYWEKSRDKIPKRNSLLIAIAPTATISDLAGCYPSIEPQISNISKKETLSGDFIVVNEYLVEDLKNLGLWNDDIKAQIKLGEGSIQHIEEIPQNLKEIYKTAWEVSGKTLITLASGRQPYIDQGQSLNLFMENPNIGALSSMYMYAWESGLKSTYYLRSRPATKIRKTTVSTKTQVTEKEAIMCSLENPEACESCQ